MPGQAEAFASTQAAWRFFRNPAVSLPLLTEPLLAHARDAAPDACQNYALVLHDWSDLSYPTHGRKRDRAVLGQAEEVGYELATALLLSDRDGRPIAPLAMRLLAADGCHDSRYATARPARPRATHLDQVAGTMTFLAGLNLPRPAVHIIDREADSVFHLRVWQGRRRLFLVRIDDRLVQHQGQRRALKDVVADLEREGEFRASRSVEYHGRPADQRVAEARVTLDGPAYQERKQADGTVRKRQVRGRPLALRLVVSRVYDAAGRLLAEWLLLTNVPAEVTAATVALWYHWRWQIESYFKLLKSAGHEAEQWQQRTAGAVARRLLVASMACVLVWQLARDARPAAKAARRLLVRLSGRQMERGREFTEEALLAGLWVLLVITEVQGLYSSEELRQLTEIVLGRYGPGLV